MTIESFSPTETRRAAGKVLRRILLVKKRNEAAVVSLDGNLGSGKTVFIKGLAAALGIKERVLSPTFLIMRSFKIRKKKIPFKRFYHIDAYRLRSGRELLDLGIKEVLADKSNLVAVEWADRIVRLLPKERVSLSFAHGKKENERIIKIK